MKRLGRTPTIAMRKTSTAMMMALLAGLLGACSGGWWPFGRSEGAAARIPAGATEYSCAEGKRLLVRFEAKSAWVYFPDREFRLDQSADERYGNGVTTLSLQGDSAHLDTEGKRQFADCKRKSP
jgi:hypothetical protein